MLNKGPPLQLMEMLTVSQDGLVVAIPIIGATQRGTLTCLRSPGWGGRGGLYFVQVSLPSTAQCLGRRSGAGEALPGCWGDLSFVSGFKVVREVLRSGTEWGAGLNLSRVRFLSGQRQEEGFPVSCPGQGWGASLDKATLGRPSCSARPRGQGLISGGSLEPWE